MTDIRKDLTAEIIIYGGYRAIIDSEFEHIINRKKWFIDAYQDWLKDMQENAIGKFMGDWK